MTNNPAWQWGKPYERNSTNGSTEKVRPSMETGKTGENRKEEGTPHPTQSYLIETGEGRALGVPKQGSREG
jgi:hypothetical protein